MNAKSCLSSDPGAIQGKLTPLELSNACSVTSVMRISRAIILMNFTRQVTARKNGTILVLTTTLMYTNFRNTLPQPHQQPLKLFYFKKLAYQNFIR